MGRSGPKAWKTKAKRALKTWAKSYTWKPKAKKAEALRGTSVALVRSPPVHRFSRWTGEGIYQLAVNGAGGNLNWDSGTATFPVAINTPVTDIPYGFNCMQFAGACQFTLKDLPDYTDFTSLFDRYEIEQVDMEINCIYNSASAGTATQVMPTITYVPDFDDSVFPASPADISQYQRAKTWTFRGNGHPLKVSIKPRVSIPVDASAAAFAPGPTSTMLSVANAAVPYYGFKFWVRGVAFSTVNPTSSLSFKCKYHLKLQDPK